VLTEHDYPKRLIATVVTTLCSVLSQSVVNVFYKLICLYQVLGFVSLTIQSLKKEERSISEEDDKDNYERR